MSLSGVTGFFVPGGLLTSGDCTLGFYGVDGAGVEPISSRTCLAAGLHRFDGGGEGGLRESGSVPTD
ncbi:MAG: hypothetical protein RL693_344 [Verrucomicrobiota bacterium]